MPKRMEATQMTAAIRLAGAAFSLFLYKSHPRNGEVRVMMITDIDAIPPIRPMTTPSLTTVLRKVCPSTAPSLLSGHREVREMAVALRNEEVTSTIMTMVNPMKRLNPVG